jgi:hypothetical protein
MEFLAALAVVTTLGVPGRTNANLSIAADGRTVAVAWAAADANGAADIYLATSADDGRTFGSPVRVNDAAGDARVTGEQPPRVVLVPRPRAQPAVVVVWTAKGPNGTRLLQARSDDGGRTFARAAVVADTDATGNRGWEAIAAAPDGGVDAVWLDHRDMAGHPAGHMSPEQSKLYFAAMASTGAWGTVSAGPKPITGGVCYCCKTALAIAPDGSIYAAWRHVYPGNLRDIAFTMSHDGGRTFTGPVRVSEDHWMLEGCPDDGPALALDRQRAVHIVWPTLVQGASKDADPTIGIFYTTSRDGRSFAKRERLPADGLPHHPQIAISPDGAVAVAWDELKNGARRPVVVRLRVGAGGQVTAVREALPGNPTGIYPVLAATQDGFVAAWSTAVAGDSRIAVVGLPAR